MFNILEILKKSYIFVFGIWKVRYSFLADLSHTLTSTNVLYEQDCSSVFFQTLQWSCSQLVHYATGWTSGHALTQLHTLVIWDMGNQILRSSCHGSSVDGNEAQMAWTHMAKLPWNESRVTCNSLQFKFAYSPYVSTLCHN